MFPNDDANADVHGLAYEQLDEVHVERVDFGKMRNLHFSTYSIHICGYTNLNSDLSTLLDSTDLFRAAYHIRFSNQKIVNLFTVHTNICTCGFIINK